MNRRTLGRTGLEVGELSLGGLFVSSVGGEFEQSRAAIHRAIEIGVNYIDTAPSYANSEEVIGKSLEDLDAPLIISTKLGGRPKPFEPQDVDGLRQSVEESLRLLKRDQIDILFIHEPDRPGEYAWWTDLDTFDGPVVGVLEDLKKQDVIRFTGLGGTTSYEMARVMQTGKFDVVLTAFNYSLLWREAEHAILPAAKEHDMGVVVGSPLHQGSLSKRYDDHVRDGFPWLSPPRRAQLLELYDFVDELGMPLPELALRFVLSNPDVSCALMGARSVEEVDLNAAAVERGPLPEDVLTRLDEIYTMVPFRPYLEPAVLRFGGAYPWPGAVR